jgi:hypothetical protein
MVALELLDSGLRGKAIPIGFMSRRAGTRRRDHEAVGIEPCLESRDFRPSVPYLKVVGERRLHRRGLGMRLEEAVPYEMLVPKLMVEVPTIFVLKVIVAEDASGLPDDMVYGYMIRAELAALTWWARAIKPQMAKVIVITMIWDFFKAKQLYHSGFRR